MTISPLAPRAAPTFLDRSAAGRALARELGGVALRPGTLVLGMARGGVIVARKVSDVLGLPLDVFVARKLGVPGLPEVALGAIAEGSRKVMLDDAAWFMGIPRHVIGKVVLAERRELARRIDAYRGGRPLQEVRGRDVLLVDDGLASGATLTGAVRALRRLRPARIVVAVPVAQRDGADAIRALGVDVVAVVETPELGMVSDWYGNFPAVSDSQVRRALGIVSTADIATVPWNGGAENEVPDESPVTIPLAGGASLAGDLGLPAGHPHGLAILAHGGGSSRKSYRNRYMAARLRLAGYSTLRVDLLTPREEEADEGTASERFDIPRLASRVIAAIDWAGAHGVAGWDRVVLVGASTGAAAALIAAAERSVQVAAVISRGGRVDLAGDSTSRVQAPVLMIAGGNDARVLSWNRAVRRELRAPARVTVIRGAGHVFEEPGALGAVAERAVRWLAWRRLIGRV